MKHFLTIIFALLALTASAQVKEIHSLADIPDNGHPIIIKAYADWCGPCRAYTPIFHAVAESYAGKIDFYQIDIDNPKSRQFVNDYNITAIPQTIILCGKYCKNPRKISGLQTRTALIDYIERATGLSPQHAMTKTIRRSSRRTTPTIKIKLPYPDRRVLVLRK